MQELTFSRKAHLVPQIVLVDGITRVGKSMLGPILASLDRVEIERVEAIFEYTALLYAAGAIRKDAAVELLQLEADTKMYESYIGRNTNFRKKDHSSVFNNPFKWRYLRRLWREDGQSVVEDIRRENPIFQVQTHDVMTMIEPFFEAFEERLSVVQMFRDPVDLVHSWYRRGWGRRWSDDPLSLTFTVRSGEDVAPWYDILIGGMYTSLSEMDRIIFMIEALQKKLVQTYEELSDRQKSQALWICFEDFVTEPEKDLRRIESFLKTSRTRSTARQLKKERCPRVLLEEDRKKKEELIRGKAGPEGLEKLDNLRKLYSRFNVFCAQV